MEMELIQNDETYQLFIPYCSMSFSRHPKGLEILLVFLNVLLEATDNPEVVDSLSGSIACIEMEIAGVPLTIH